MKLGIDEKISVLYRIICCDISNFSEFHQDYESAGFIIIGENWIFANFVT